MDFEIQQSVITDPNRLLTAHIHEWKPMIGWIARYRCPGCKAIGYKKDIVLGDDEYSGFGARTKLRDLIVPYTCTKNGCHGWAVGKDYTSEKARSKCGTRSWRCRWHRGVGVDTSNE